MTRVRRLQIPEIEAPRLRLTALTRSHSAGMFELWREPTVCEHAGPAVDAAGTAIELPVASRTDSDRLLAYWVDREQAGTGFRWAVLSRTSGEFLGAVGFNALGTKPELAYHFVPRHQGSGFATEASRAALAWAFSSGATKVTCEIDVLNTRSIALARRLGFAGSSLEKGGTRCFVLGRDSHTA